MKPHHSLPWSLTHPMGAARVERNIRPALSDKIGMCGDQIGIASHLTQILTSLREVIHPIMVDAVGVQN